MKKQKIKIPSQVSAYMARIGALGGKAGTGAAKARPMPRAKAQAMAKARRDRWRGMSATAKAEQRKRLGNRLPELHATR